MAKNYGGERNQATSDGEEGRVKEIRQPLMGRRGG